VLISTVAEHITVPVVVTILTVWVWEFPEIFHLPNSVTVIGEAPMMILYPMQPV
jgi:hypothetical protein